jgi:hypothetical protein
MKRWCGNAERHQRAATGALAAKDGKPSPFDDDDGGGFRSRKISRLNGVDSGEGR